VKTRFQARGRGVRLLALAVGLMTTTGTAYAATTPVARVTMAKAGSQETVRYGKPVRLEGFAVHANPGRRVRLEYAPTGRPWRPLATAQTASGGEYAFSVRAHQSGAYRAVAEGGAASAPRKLTVVPQLGARAKRHVHRGGAVRVKGVLRPGVAGRRLRLEVRTRGGWKAVGRSRTRSGGRFAAAWRPQRHGEFRVRVRFKGDRLNAGASRSLGRRVYVYRPSAASWYGPGLYGGHLACGGTLSAGKLGVANKSLPCGTRVTLRYGGRSVRVPVIDRGPFAGGREWDLTAATKSRLGFPSTGTVWTTR
jgi:rare lipoprotein A